jgi:hypothetical protein
VREQVPDGGYSREFWRLMAARAALLRWRTLCGSRSPLPDRLQAAGATTSGRVANVGAWGRMLGFGGGIVDRAASDATSAYTGDSASTVTVFSAAQRGVTRVLVDRPLVRGGVSGDAWSVMFPACPRAGV